MKMSEAANQTPAGGAPSEAVCVVVHVRPLIDLEIDQGCAECLTVTPGVPQVGSGPHRFTYDQVLGGDCGQDPELLYDRCVAPLVDGLFKGFNATVFAYGQTGSGKTYTMGSAFPQDSQAQFQGVIPRVLAAIFDRIAETPGVDFAVRVGFVEIHKEDVHDLLRRGQGGGRSAAAVHIRELPSGGIVLAGATEREVRTSEEMAQVLEEGTALRATAETGMNKTSSRSHAIFTITLEQRRIPRQKTPRSPRAASDSDGGDSEAEEEEEEEDDLDAYLCAKMHLVDLAGSERVKRTKAQGQRLQEGININKGLLALGNVINALSEGKSHVPYRDSKLTRMLQDSLGGNSRTTMIACVSPADVNLEETLNTLRYADRARSIKNKPVVNRDPVAAQIAALRQQLAAARAENEDLRRRLAASPRDEGDEMAAGGGAGALAAALEQAEARLQVLDRSNARLRVEVQDMQGELKEATERQLVAQMQRDRVARVLGESAGPEAAQAALQAAGVPPEEGSVEAAQAARVRELGAEVRRLKRLARMPAAGQFATPQTPPPNGATPGGPFGSGPLHSSHATPLSPTASGSEESGGGLEAGDEELLVQEMAHRAEMARVQHEIDALQQLLEGKEAAIAEVTGSTAARDTYECQLREVAAERDALARERSDLLTKLRSLQAASVEERQRLERAYKERIRELDARAKEADRKERRIRELEAHRARALDAVQALERDIQAIRTQKVALARQADRSAKEFAAWKRQRDTEVAHLRKAGRANAAQLIRMEALHSKQQEVLRRKTEEAAAARKRLKQMEDRRGRARPLSARTAPPPPSRPSTTAFALHSAAPAAFEQLESAAVEVPVQPNSGAPVLRDEAARREWVEAELDACCPAADLQRVLEGEKAQRSEAARQLREVERRLAALKNPQWWGAFRSTGKPINEEALLKRKARLAAAVERHGTCIQEVQLQLVKARASEEGRGAGAADARRWTGLQAAPEARGLLTTVFRCASQYRAQAAEQALTVTELSEEVEMLRLRLQVAEAERLEAARKTAEAEAAAAAEQAGSVVGGGADTPTQADSLLQPASANGTAEAPGVGRQQLTQTPEEGGGAEAGDHDAAQVQQDEEADDAWDSEEEEDDFEEEEDEDEETEDEADAWDPSTATPLVGGKTRRRGQQPQPQRPESGGSSSGAAKATSPGEAAALVRLNAQRAERGEPAVPRLTVPVLRAALKGCTIDGQEWRAGSKKRGQLLQEFKAVVEAGDTAQPQAPTLTTDQSSKSAAAEHGAAAPAAARSEASAGTPVIAQRCAALPEGFSPKCGSDNPGSGGRRSPFKHIKEMLGMQRSSPTAAQAHAAKVSPLRMLGKHLGRHHSKAAEHPAGSGLAAELPSLSPPPSPPSIAAVSAAGVGAAWAPVQPAVGSAGRTAGVPSLAAPLQAAAEDDAMEYLVTSPAGGGGTSQEVTPEAVDSVARGPGFDSEGALTAGSLLHTTSSMVSIKARRPVKSNFSVDQEGDLPGQGRRGTSAKEGPPMGTSGSSSTSSKSTGLPGAASSKRRAWVPSA